MGAPRTGRASATRRRQEPGEGVLSGSHPGLQGAAVLQALHMGTARTVCTRQWPQSLPPPRATNYGQAPGRCSRVTPASGARCQLLEPCPAGSSGGEQACTRPTGALLPGGPPPRAFPTEGGERVVFLPFCSPDQDVAHPKFVNIVQTFSKRGRNQGCPCWQPLTSGSHLRPGRDCLVSSLLQVCRVEPG